MTYFQSLLGAHFAVFFMGITGLLAAASGFGPWHVTSYRVTLGGLFLLAVLAWRRTPPPSLKKSVELLGMGFLLSIHWYTFFLSLELLGLMLGYAMTGTQPLMIALLGRFLLKEHISRTTAISLGIALLGFACLGLFPDESSQFWLGILVSLGSFLIFSFLVLYNRKQVQGVSVLWVTTLEMLGAIPLTLVWTWRDWMPANGEAWIYAIFLGLVCTGLAYLVYNGSMRMLAAPTAGLVLSLEVVYGMVGGYFMGDSLTPMQFLAALLISNIIVFDVWAYRRYRRRN